MDRDAEFQASRGFVTSSVRTRRGQQSEKFPDQGTVTRPPCSIYARVNCRTRLVHSRTRAPAKLVSTIMDFRAFVAKAPHLTIPRQRTLVYGGKLLFSNATAKAISQKRHDGFWLLRGAWRDHRFPEPFSWFLHETGLESLKITSARCFLLKCHRKDSKKAKEHRQFRGVLGRWRTAAIDSTTFHACQWCRKTVVFAVFSRLWGVIWRGKAFRDQQCQFLTRNKSLSIENESNCSMTYECVRTDSILPRGAGLEHSRYKQSIFSLSIFGILVERLSF